MDVVKTPEPPLECDIDSDVYVLGTLVIAHSQNANLCYVLSEPLKYNGKPPPNCDIDSDVYVLVFAD